MQSRQTQKAYPAAQLMRYVVADMDDIASALEMASSDLKIYSLLSWSQSENTVELASGNLEMLLSQSTKYSAS